MQTLTIWPSSSEWNSGILPRMSLELSSCSGSLHWREKRKRLGIHHISSGVVLYCCGYCKGFINKCLSSHIVRHCELNLLSYPNKEFRGVLFALPCALEQPTLDDNVAEAGSDNKHEFPQNRDGMKLTPVHLDEGLGISSKFNENRENDEDGKDDGIDAEKQGRNGRSTRINVRALAWSLRSAKTADDVEEVLKEKGELPLQVYSTIIKGFGRDKRIESAMAIFEWLKRKNKEAGSPIQPNLFIYNSLLGAMKQAECFDFVDEVIGDMAMEGVRPNVVTINTLMGIYIEQGREVKALQLFVEMPNKGLSPSPASYSIVLLAYRRLEDGFGALTFFVEIKDKHQRGEIGKDEEEEEEDWNYEITKLENFTFRICYQVMRRWLAAKDNLRTKVLKLLTEMDKAGLHHGRAEYERLIWACTREDHCVVAKELYSRIREMGTGSISLSVCNHVIWLMGKAKKWWAALEIYEDLLDIGPKPNNMSYELVVSHFNILLSAARKKGIWRWGMRLLDKMEEKGLKPGSREWNSVLIACAKASQTSAAVQIFKRMVEHDEKPTIISYGALLSALEKGKLYEEALRVWKHMIKVGVEPNLYAYTIMASIYADQGRFDTVDSIIREMGVVGIEPTVVTFNAIITRCAQHNLGNTAHEWFQRMKVENVTPNEVTYEMLIEALASDGKPRVAYEMYLRARNEGLELSCKAYDAVVESSQAYGATIDVSSLGPRPRPPPEKKKRGQVRKDESLSSGGDDDDDDDGGGHRRERFEKREIHVQQQKSPIF
ncbi:protein LOW PHOTOSYNTHETIC EFFICIENCY 1, chloroplastic-like [Andrographis paniculata]|uniref:protein LOW PHOTOSYNTHETIC EFFICIENCY 1, chloroplastic-like n=1 Tax=Andrographis paniculata TaxID=175694 RepID=UPI0021E89AC2|nr:protein LOW PHOTOSYNTHETIC EFFICIENCY 1, chloroplastic-like [Andrographis paniculata]